MTLLQLQDRILERIGEHGAVDGFYSRAEVTNAINEAQRVFVLATLCLEKTATFTLNGNQTWYTLFSTFPDFIVPLALRVQGTSGNKLTPETLRSLDNRNPSWQAETGSPRSYVVNGFNLFGVYPAPAATTTLDFTYAYSPTTLTYDSQVPQIPEEYHDDLILYCLPRLRVKEGGAEFAKHAPLMNRFWESTQKLANYVRHRNIGSRYDTVPAELQFTDITNTEVTQWRTT